ncbi:GPW/gp25 family protein [Nitrospira sp. Nam74]
MSIDKTFLGTGWSFPPEFQGQAKAVKMVSDEEDIRHSLWILLSTAPGERTMQPAYGCGLRTLAFESLSASVCTEMQDMIERAILFFEPRITLDRIVVCSEEMAQGLIEIELTYTIRTTNTRSNMVYPFYFLEGTNLPLR